MNRKIIDELFERYRQFGHRSYGEEVTELEHALQTALLAREHGEEAPLIAAALLHDCGHLLHDLGEEIADEGIDAVHEMIGAELLSAHFPATVSEPVRLHVAAKRYLCQAEPGYLEELSAASQLSLSLQGGPMTSAEARSFENYPFFQSAVRLRRYDDAAKMIQVSTPSLESFRSLLIALLLDPSKSMGEGDSQ